MNKPGGLTRPLEGVGFRVLTGNQWITLPKALTHAGGFPKGVTLHQSALISSPPAVARAFLRPMIAGISRSLVGVSTTGVTDRPLLWECSERAAGAAKVAPLGRKAPGYVRRMTVHVEGKPVHSRDGWFLLRNPVHG